MLWSTAGVRRPRLAAANGSRAARVPGLFRRDAPVLALWALSRLPVLVLSWAAMYVTQGSAHAVRPWLGEWQQWDAGLFTHIARYGYSGPQAAPIPNLAAFLPGYPDAVLLAHLVVREWTLAALAVSLIAGTVAVVALSRLADSYAAGSGQRTVLFWVASPAAIFLAAGYSESLFLAFALCAWLAARDGQWMRAAVLTGAASITRVEGLFLFAALALAALLHAERRGRALASLALALIPPSGYELYLRASTGDWLAWSHAEQAGWDRHYTGPLATLHTTWWAAFGHPFAAPYSFAFQLELLAMAAGLAGTVALLVARRWPEAVYCGLTLGALATATWYESVPRALLLLWPLWHGLALIAKRWPWAGWVYLSVSVPLAAVIGLLYLTGGWAG